MRQLAERGGRRDRPCIEYRAPSIVNTLRPGSASAPTRKEQNRQQGGEGQQQSAHGGDRPKPATHRFFDHRNIISAAKK